MSNLRRRQISWHARCIDYWYQPNKYYERPIRIQLRSLSTLGRKRPWRPRDFSLCDLFSQCGLIHLAICADSSENLCAWSRCVRSLPHDYDTSLKRADVAVLSLLSAGMLQHVDKQILRTWRIFRHPIADSLHVMSLDGINVPDEYTKFLQTHMML